MRSEWEIFGSASEGYADVLGQKGLKEYHRLAEAEWSHVPALQAGENDPQQYGSRFRITSIMEALARESGDVEELINIKRRDLSQPYAYLQIAAADPDRLRVIDATFSVEEIHAHVLELVMPLIESRGQRSKVRG